MSNLSDAESFFEGQGWTPAQAQGIAAGLYAESGLNPSAVNPTSGATGIAQWLGSRLSGLFGSGNSSTLQGQLQYVQNELTGSESAAGGVIGSQSTASGALSAFITDFERPAAGGETTGDISRGTAALGQLGTSSTATANDPLGSSLTIDPNGASEFNSAAATGALGNDQGTPNLGGGVSNTSGQAIPASSTQNLGAGGGQPVNITDLPGLDTTVKGAGSAIQSGAQNAATGLTGTLASAVNSLEDYTNSAFVIFALVVVGAILLAYGLGLFKHGLAIPIPIPV